MSKECGEPTCSERNRDFVNPLWKTNATVGDIRRINTRGCPLCRNLILGIVSNAHYPSIHPCRVIVGQHIDRCITESKKKLHYESCKKWLSQT